MPLELSAPGSAGPLAGVSFSGLLASAAAWCFSPILLLLRPQPPTGPWPQHPCAIVPTTFWGGTSPTCGPAGLPLRLWRLRRISAVASGLIFSRLVRAAEWLHLLALQALMYGLLGP